MTSVAISQESSYSRVPGTGTQNPGDSQKFFTIKFWYQRGLSHTIAYLNEIKIDISESRNYKFSSLKTIIFKVKIFFFKKYLRSQFIIEMTD